MAERPWVSPKDVKSYTDLDDVRERSDNKLVFDILRAESYIIDTTHNNFEEDEVIPEDVRVATIILSERYAHNSTIAGSEKKSESFDDYSYTAESSQIDVESLGLDTLLKPYTKEQPSGNVIMRIHRL